MPPPADAPFYEPVSLGELCEPKYQTARVLNARLNPNRSQMAFRYRIGTPTRDASISGWRLFDWRTTPLEAVCETLERDFEGVFELEDLVPTERGAHNTRFKTYHVHEFALPPEQGILTPEQIAEQYPQARRNFDLLVEDFRALLHRPGPYLYVIQSARYPAPETMERLVRLLERDPAHRFQILVVGVEGFDSDLSALSDRVSKAWRTLESDKPDKFKWEGDDASWDRILEPWSLGYHEAGFHDLTAQPGWGPPSSTPKPVEVDGAATRPRQAAAPPPEARLVWSGGPQAVYCAEFWRERGAVLETRPDGVHIRTIPQAWTYSQAATLDLSGVDLERQHVWVRLQVAQVRGPLLVGLYRADDDVLTEEVPVEEGDGASLIYFPIKQSHRTVLMFRTGKIDAAAEALVTGVDIFALDVA